MNTQLEPTLRVTDSLDNFDVCIVGGGLAGICAAIAAAREGAQTVLIQNRPVLGGNSSSEIRVPPFGAGHYNPLANETGIILELLNEERARSHDTVDYSNANAHWDLALLDAVKREPNLKLLLNANVFHVEMNGARVQSVTASQTGTERVWRVSADYFMDCSGDGALGVGAGVPFRIGQEARGEYDESLAPEIGWDWTLGSSLFFRARDIGRPAPFEPPAWAACSPDEESLCHRSHKPLTSGYWWIEVGYPYDTIADNEEIRDEALRHVLGVWDHIKNHCEDREQATNYALDWVGMVPGKRESRRFVGAHVRTQNEVQERFLFPDRIAYGGWIIDDHTKGGILAKGEAPNPHDHLSLDQFLVSPYSVSLRSLYANEVENLFFAGRLMSVSRLVFNSLRVQRTLAVIGQAAGTAVARAVEVGRAPGQFNTDDITQIQQSLLRQDCWIPQLPNADPRDLARQAKVSASSSLAYEVQAGEKGVDLKMSHAQLIPLTQTPERVRVFLRNESGEARTMKAAFHRAADAWDLPTLHGESICEIAFELSANHDGVLEIEVPRGANWGELPAYFWLRIEEAPSVIWLLQANALPGVAAAKFDADEWSFSPKIFSTWAPLAADVWPRSRPYEAANINNGFARPETMPNLWVSAADFDDSDAATPPSCRLEWDEAVELSRVQIAWGLDFSRDYIHMTPYFRAPECASDYQIEAELEDGTRALWCEVRGNYQRLRVHDCPAGLDGAQVKALIISVEATNGAPSVSICEVRAERAG